jgi:23S rRNA (adenine2503-C2)-methyltransferase
MKRLPLSGMFPEELSGALECKPFQARQLFAWIHRRGITEFSRMTDLPRDLRRHLEEKYTVRAARVETVQESAATGTRKALLCLADGEAVEAVRLRDSERITLCLSSQAGCPLGCHFCATAASGYRRNLTPGEITDQVYALCAEEDPGGRTPNIVYMGMGEPFLNYDAVIASIRLLMHEQGMNIGARKITVSTAGILPGIQRFSREDWQVRLSVSLHAANNALRSELMPVNGKYPLEQLKHSLREYNEITGRRFTVEWTLLKGVNDREADARQLIQYLQGLKASVNLIPWNAVADLPFSSPPPEHTARFQKILEHAGISVTIRREKGGDIDAACGQLRRRRIGNIPLPH